MGLRTEWLLVPILVLEWSLVLIILVPLIMVWRVLHREVNKSTKKPG